MSYQSVLRGTNNALVTNQNVFVKISILQGAISGTSVYVETHSTSTNSNGLISLSIGGGTLVSGSFSAINWANGPYFVQMEADPTGGTNYTISGTTQLLSVPYALHAKTAESLVGGSTGGTGNLVLPTITTNSVTGITSNSATFGGNISNANSNQIMERGIVYSTSPNPTIQSSKIVVGKGIGSFDTLSGLGYSYAHILKSNTTYYVRAYALTENNISSYGNEVSFTTLPVGQTGTGGGIVFFDKGNSSGGWQYIEATPSNQSTGIIWGCSGTSITGTQLTIGSGEVNTSLIVAGCNDASFAAKLCDNLSFGGQTDWVLPSRDELNLIYKNLHLNGLGSFDTSTAYWTSNQSSSLPASHALGFRFSDGVAHDGNGSWGGKNANNLVRAVRAF
jgi:hypothetical protein